MKTIINGEVWIMAEPTVPENLDAWLGTEAVFRFLDEQEEIARAIADDTELSWKRHLDEAWDMVEELRAFAAVWDLCAVSQGHPGVETVIHA